MRARAFVGVGSNIEPESNILRAFMLLKLNAKIVAVSTLYWSKPLGDRDIQFFLNGVWEIDTDRKPAFILSMLKRVEYECGRVRDGDRYGSRVIDLDLLLYNGMIDAGEGGRLVHPDIRERAFVALPLFELAPELVLPDTGEQLSAIAGAMSVQGLVRNDSFTERLRKEMLDE